MGRLEDALQTFADLGIGEQLDYAKFHLYSIITHSTAIEGSTVTETENQVLFDQGIGARKPLAEQLMNLDLKQAYEKGFDLARRHVDYTTGMLCDLSAAVMHGTGSAYTTISGSFDSSMGDLRLINVSAGRGGRSYLAWQKVPQRLSAFCTWLNGERASLAADDAARVYALSFEAHYRLVCIHPWADGNGRMARLVMNMLQHEFGAVPSIVTSDHRAEYIDALAAAREADDPEPFIDFMLEQHIANIEQQIAEYRRSVEGA